MAKRTVKPRASKTVKAIETLSTGTEPLAQAADMKGRARAKTIASEPTDENVRLRAYHRYLERGGGPGEAIDDWVAAERDLRQE